MLPPRGGGPGHSERDLAVVDVAALGLCFAALLLRLARRRRTARSRAPVATAGATAAGAARRADELEVLDHDLELVALAAVLALPGRVLEPSLDEQRAAL